MPVKSKCYCVWILNFWDEDQMIIKQEVFAGELSKKEIITYANKVVKASIKNNDEIRDYNLKILDIIKLKGLNEKLKAEAELLEKD